MSSKWHKLLLRQLKRSGFSAPEEMSEEHVAFLEKVSKSYKEADEERKLTNHSIEVSSREMEKLYAKLEGHNDELEKQVLRRTHELTKANRLFRSLSELAPVGIFRSDKTRNLVYINQFFREIFNRKDDTLLGNRWREFVFLENQEESRNFENFADETENSSHFEFQISIHDGQRKWVKMQTIPLQDDNGQVAGFVGTLEDITKHKHYEQSLLQSKEAAERATRAKSRFLATMSHELRTPLNAILGFAQIMQRDSAATPNQLENLDRINRNGSHLLGLINDVLEISKIESGKTRLTTRPCNLHRLLKDLKDIFHHQADQKGLRFSVSGYRSVPKHIVTDERKLRQILINLLSNAIKFTSHGFVKLAVSVKSNSKLLSCGKQALKLQFKIVDTGKGIAEEEKEKLFKAFSQTASGEDLQEGIGLGLNISQEFARMLDGGISVESEPDKGSTFFLDIRTWVADRSSVEAIPAKGSVIGIEPDQTTNRVLIVDDNEDNREILAEFIQVIGFPIREANNGKEAIRIFKAWNPTLVFMDLMMPIMDGFETTRKIRKIDTKNTVIIALTAGAFNRAEKEYCKKGFDDVIFKPFQENILFSKISKHLKVNYLHQNLSPRLNTSSSSHWSMDVSVNELAQQPITWRKKLYTMALEGEADEGKKLVAEISAKYPQLAESLYQLIEYYQFDKLVNLVNEAIGENDNEQK